MPATAESRSCWLCGGRSLHVPSAPTPSAALPPAAGDASERVALGRMRSGDELAKPVSSSASSVIRRISSFAVVAPRPVVALVALCFDGVLAELVLGCAVLGGVRHAAEEKVSRARAC